MKAAEHTSWRGSGRTRGKRKQSIGMGTPLRSINEKWSGSGGQGGGVPKFDEHRGYGVGTGGKHWEGVRS